MLFTLFTGLKNFLNIFKVQFNAYVHLFILWVEIHVTWDESDESRYALDRISQSIPERDGYVLIKTTK